MPKLWLNVRQSDSRVVGWQRTSKDIIPPDDAEVTRVEVADLAPFLALEASLAADGRPADIFWRNSALETDPDTRPVVRITSDKAEVDISLNETATITFSLLRANGTVNTGFNGTVRAKIAGRSFKLTFVAGVATKAFAPKESGDVTFASTDQAKVETPLTIEVVE